MTNINSTWTGFPTDPLGVTLVVTFFVIGLIASGVGLITLVIYITEKVEGHFRRIDEIEEKMKALEKSSVSSETKTGE